MARPPALVLLCALSFGAIAAPALAQQPTRPARAPEPLARTLKGAAKDEYDLALALLREGDSASALRKFRRAYELQADPRLLFNMAICEKNLRHYAKALVLAEKFLAAGDALITAEERDAATQFTRAARTLVGDLTVTCTETDAVIYVDDERADAGCNVAFKADEGPRKIRVTKPGFKDATTTASVPGGGAVGVSVTLARESHEGRVTVNAGPGEVITIDGTNVGTHSWSGMLAAGKHTVVVSGRGMKSFRSEIDVRDNDDRNLMVTLESETPKWPFIVGGGVLLAGAIVGGFFLFKPKDAAPTYGTLGGYPPR